MKKFYFLALVLCTQVHAQIITFSDPNLKAKLLEADVTNTIAQADGFGQGDYIKIDTNNNSEIEVSEALTVFRLNLFNSGISDMTGISYFTNLKILGMNSNNVQDLDVSALVNLEELHCNQNNMLELDVSNLASLKVLACDMNPLSSLDITDLTALELIDCSYTEIETMNFVDKNALAVVRAYFNPALTSMTFENCTLVHTVECFSSNLSTLTFDNCPNLKDLNCQNNKLTSLDISGSTDFWELDCSMNDLTSLNVTGLWIMHTLRCYENQLIELDLTGLSGLGTLQAQDNNLNYLDAGDCPLQFINVSGNDLYFVSIKNSRTEISTNFSGNPNLAYICVDESQIEAIQSQVQAAIPNCVVGSYCSFVPGLYYFEFRGENRLDADMNGCSDNDSPFPNVKFSITTGTETGTVISNGNGEYMIPLQAGTHVINPVLENPGYFSVSPPSVTLTLSGTPDLPIEQDFCFTPIGVHPDLEVVILPVSAARPGFDAIYQIIYRNKGNVTLSGSLTLSFQDDVMDMVTSIPPATQSLGSLTWDFSGLDPFETGSIMIVYNINSPVDIPPVTAGELLTFTAVVNSLQSEETPADNISTLNQIVVNSFDPNDITCLEGDVVGPGLIGQYVHYLIRFENTGTFAAENIVVKDMIDIAKFDVNSLIPISGSHSFETRISNTNQVEFIFENIDLPFDDTNDDGYIAFKIRTLPTLVIGDTFSNSAEIYFDYNFPIVTNTATTLIQALSTQEVGMSHEISIAPNPAASILNIVHPDGVGIKSVSIYDVSGRIVMDQINHDNNTIDVSSLARGTYLIRLISNGGATTLKFLKE